MKKKLFSNVIVNGIILLMLVSVAVICFNSGSQYVFSSNVNEAIYSGDRSSNKVSLMINVYWGTEYLDSILATLKEYGVKCTFFVGGQWVEKEPEMLKKIYDAGHEIGNHGYFHQDQGSLSYDQNYDEIKACHQIVKSTIGYDMNLFAPPSGDFSNTTLKVAQALGYSTIMWSRDTIDWRDKSSELVYTRCTKGIKGGDLILMHPTEHTAAALKDVLQYYANHNLKPCTVSENLAIKSH